MRPLDTEQAESLQRKIAETYKGAPMEDKDVEVLADILHTEPMLKALGRLRADAEEAAFGLITVDLGNEVGRHTASRLQGAVRGRLGTIEALIGLATLPEENEDGSTAAE